MEELAFTEIEFRERVCRADRKCHNECKLKIYNFGGRKGIWGGECGRYEVRDRDGPGQPDLFQERDELFREFLEGRAAIPEEGAHQGIPGSGKRVGIAS